jgi:hypothetical protein
MRKLASTQQSQESQQQLLRAAESTVGNEPRRPAAPGRKKAGKPATPQSRALAIGLALGGVIALGFGVWFALRDTSATYDLSDVAGTLQLAKGRAAGPSLTATIVDPKWESMKPDERKHAAGTVMDVEVGKGIKSLILLDANGAAKAMVNETPNGRTVVLP